MGVHTNARGVCQGDPLSPMLFILAMDPLQRLLDLATQHGTLSPLPPTATRWRTSLYADDAAIFINPRKEDLETVKAILQAFGNFSGLHINLEKSSIHPIRCEEVDLDHVLFSFAGIKGTFPCRYLGLLLHTRTLASAKGFPDGKEDGSTSCPPHPSLFGPLIHGHIPPYGVLARGLGEEKNQQN